MSRQERVHPGVEEVPLEFNDEQHKALNDMKAELAKHEAEYKTSDIRDATLARFLRHASFNASQAAQRFVEYLAWRKENNVDQVLSKPYENEKVIRSIIPYAYSGVDNDGRPVYIEKTGSIRCNELVSSDVVKLEDFYQSHVWGIEHLGELMQSESEKRGKRIDDFATILDMSGLGFQHRNAIHLLKGCMEMDYKYFPERVGKVYVINTPWVAPYLYQLVQVFLDPLTKSRIHVVHGDPKDFLPTVIPKSSLPKEYGGDLDMPELRVSDAASTEEEGAGLDTETISYEFVKELECDADGATFNWYFNCQHGYDIDFSVEIQTPGVKADKPTYAKIPSRCTTSKGSYKAAGACKLVFKWDNNFSYFTNKTIKYSVNVLKLDQAEEHLLEQ